MKVERLTLRNFRNVQESELFPDETVNFLVGRNGQGKTTFIEALGFLASLRSFRETKSANIIRHGSLISDISCRLKSDHPKPDHWNADLRITLETEDDTRQKATKTAYFNGKPFRSSVQYLTKILGSAGVGFHTVIFSPADHDLVRGDPSIRRAYLDRVIAAENTEYLAILQKYRRLLEQRNAVLKSKTPVSREVLFGFTQPLCNYAAQLVYKRLDWVRRLNSVLPQALDRINPGHLPVRAAYLSNWVPEIENLSFNNNNLNSIHFTGQGALPSLELLEQSFWQKVSACEAAEWKAGFSLVGPHRDDWVFFLEDQPLKGRGSQGEVRSVLLALKLSEIELFRNETMHRPLFLLDDFSSELDRERRAFLLRFLMETDLQTFVTTTEDASYVGKRHWVMNGRIIEGTHDHRAKSV